MFKQVSGVWSPAGIILIALDEDGNVWKLEPPGMAWILVTSTRI